MYRPGSHTETMDIFGLAVDTFEAANLNTGNLDDALYQFLGRWEIGEAHGLGYLQSDIYDYRKLGNLKRYISRYKI